MTQFQKKPIPEGAPPDFQRDQKRRKPREGDAQYDAKLPKTKDGHLVRQHTRTLTADPHAVMLAESEEFLAEFPSPLVVTAKHIVPRGKPGRLVGSKIRNSGHRAEIDLMLFRDGLPFAEVIRRCEEQWGLHMNVRTLRNYCEVQQDGGMADLLAIPNAIAIRNLEESVRSRFMLQDAIIGQGWRLVKKGDVTMDHVLRAIALQQKDLTSQGSLRLMTVDSLYKDALESVLTILREICTEDQLKDLQTRLLQDEAFLAAMHDRLVDPQTTVAQEGMADAAYTAERLEVAAI